MAMSERSGRELDGREESDKVGKRVGRSGREWELRSGRE